VLLIGQQHGDEPAGTEALSSSPKLAQGLLQPLLERIRCCDCSVSSLMARPSLSAGGQDIALDHFTLSTPERALARLSRDYKQLLSWMSGSIRCRTFEEKFGAVQKDVLLQ
jgi:hypothetical protein